MIPAPVTHFDETPDIYQGANTAKQKCQKNVGEEAATGLGPLAIAHVELVLANLIGDTQSDVGSPGRLSANNTAHASTNYYY